MTESVTVERLERAIHVVAEMVEQVLAQLPVFHCPILQMPQNKHDMKHEHLQPAAYRVGDAVAAVKCPRPRLRHDGAIESGDAAGLGVRGKSTEYHWVARGSGRSPHPTPPPQARER